MKTYYLFVIWLTIFLFQGCDEPFTRVIETDQSDFETRGVVYGLLSNSDHRDFIFREQNYGREKTSVVPTNRIYISNTSSQVLSNPLFYKSNVNLRSGGQELDLKFYPKTSFPQFKDPFFGVMNDIQPGKTYQLRARYNKHMAGDKGSDWQEITTSDSMPLLIPVQARDADIEFSELKTSESEGFVDIQIDDEPDRKNTYQIEVAIIQTTQNAAGEMVQLIIPAEVWGSGDRVSTEVFGNFQHHLIKESEFNREGEKRIRFSFYTNHATFNKQKAVVVMVRLSNLSDDYVRFLESSRQYFANRDNPFREPLEIYTNVRNGYGIFAFSARSYAEITVE